MFVEQFLKNQAVWFEVVRHDPAYTAGNAARAMHLPAGSIAKSVLLLVDDRPVLAVVPANHLVDLAAVVRYLNQSDVRLAPEEDLYYWFPDCEFGALPPFGSRYGVKTIVDEALAEREEIFIESNRTCEAIRLQYADYRRLESPLVAPIARAEQVIA